MLIEREQSALLLIDVQQRLLPAMSEPEQLLDSCAWLLRLASRLELPVLVSEQYPRGLGHTDPRLLELAPPDAVTEKLHFSCAAEPDCLDRIENLDRPQWVLGGIESHVCVLQTALGLHALGKEVYVVAEAVSSRRASDKQLALDRLRQAGVRIVSREMVGFEWLHKAGDDLFRQISREFLR